MYPIKSGDVFALSLVVMFLGCSASRINIAELLGPKENYPAHKRITNGNPCLEPEEPFPCKSYRKCIPMRYVCDDNYDCADRSDEDTDMCTALHRPPVEDIEAFLMSQRKWIMPNVFGNQKIPRVAHGLAVSQTLGDLSRRLGIGSKGGMNLRRVLEDVRNDDEEALEKYGMPSSAWNEVRFFFSSLIKAGFD